MATRAEPAPRPLGELDSDKEYEIVGGVPEEKVMGGLRHGAIVGRLLARLLSHVEAAGLGGVCGPDTAFRIGENERLPDVAFLSMARFPTQGQHDGVCEWAPDLAVEVISPNDVYGRVHLKIEEYLAAGVREVWLVDPFLRVVTVFRTGAPPTLVTGRQELTSESLLPGFRCPVDELFRPPAFPRNVQNNG